MRDISIDCDLRGGTGCDFVVGGLRNDILQGEAGDDHLYGGPAIDWFSGGDHINGDEAFAGDGMDQGHDGTVENYTEEGPNVPSF